MVLIPTLSAPVCSQIVFYHPDTLNYDPLLTFLLQVRHSGPKLYLNPATFTCDLRIVSTVWNIKPLSDVFLVIMLNTYFAFYTI